MQKMTSLSLPLPLPLCILFILMETLRLDSQECQPWSRGASGRPTDRPTEGTTERAASTTYNEKHRLRPRRRRGAGRTEGREDGGGRRRTEADATDTRSQRCSHRYRRRRRQCSRLPGAKFQSVAHTQVNKQKAAEKALSPLDGRSADDGQEEGRAAGQIKRLAAAAAAAMDIK